MTHLSLLVSDPSKIYNKLHCLACGETLDSWAEVDNHYRVRHPGLLEGAKRNNVSILNDCYD